MISQVLLAQGARAAGLTVTQADLQSRIDALAASLGGADKLSAWQSAHGYDDASFRSSLKLAAEAQKEGKGVAYKNDKFIGPPMVRNAKNILKKMSIVKK